MCVYVSLWILNARTMTLRHLEIFIFSALSSILHKVTFSDVSLRTWGVLLYHNFFSLFSLHMNWSVTSYHTETYQIVQPQGPGAPNSDTSIQNRLRKAEEKEVAKLGWESRRGKIRNNSKTSLHLFSRWEESFSLSFVYFLSPLLKQRALPPTTVFSAGTTLISLLSTKTQMWSYWKRTLEWIKEQSYPEDVPPQRSGENLTLYMQVKPWILQ